MSKVTVQIGFYLEGQHYAQMEAFLPRVQASKIPGLKISQREIASKALQPKTKKPAGRAAKNQYNKSQKSQSKKVESQQQILEQQDDIMNDQNEPQIEGEDEQQNLQDDQIMQERVDSQKQQQNLLHYLEDDQDSQDDDLDDDEDLSSISRSMSHIRNNPKTKRQKGQRNGLLELPDRRPRKDKKFDEATELIRRQQKQRKRKQYLKKQVQAQQKATLDKILNQTGRKLKLKEQKETLDQKRRDDRQFNNLGDAPKIITLETPQGRQIMCHNTSLFPQYMTRMPQIKIKPQCSNCGRQEGRYKIKNSSKVACSLDCYKTIIV